MILPITKLGDHILREVASAVEPTMEGLQELIDNMIETMFDAKGVGIAAPQVGKSLRLFIALDDANKPVAYINPEITYLSKRFCKYPEGCLSIPGRREDVSRPESVKLTWLDRTFQKRERLFLKREARIIQHEFDHIEGKLFIDYIDG